MDFEALVKLPKIIYYPFPKEHLGNNSNFFQIEIPIYRTDSTKIEGFGCKVEWKNNGNIGTCNEKYVLYAIVPNIGYRRVFQLEVYPENRVSHTELDGTEIFGPHIHYRKNIESIKITKKCYTKLNCDPSCRQQWFQRFSRHINAVVVETEPQTRLFSDYF